jgi:transposase
MRFYTQPHQWYCGIDLHARTMYVCILSQDGEIVFHRNIKTTPEAFLKAIAPYRDDLVVAVECMFTWYWLADLCVEEDIAFVLGHAQYMKAIHGGKAKNDRIDAQKIAVLLRGGMLPKAYAYPAKMRATRDLMRRRMKLVRQRAEHLTHIRQTNAQYNLPALSQDLKSKIHRNGVPERFDEPAVQKNIEVDLALIDYYDGLIRDVERHILAAAKQHDPVTLERLQSVPGIGPILSLVMLYEIQDIPLSPGAGFCVILSGGEVRQGIGRQTLWDVGAQDRQCALEVGLFRSGGAVSVGQPIRSEVLQSPPEKTWSRQVLDGLGA